MIFFLSQDLGWFFSVDGRKGSPFHLWAVASSSYGQWGSVSRKFQIARLCNFEFRLSEILFESGYKLIFQVKLNLSSPTCSHACIRSDELWLITSELRLHKCLTHPPSRLPKVVGVITSPLVLLSGHLSKYWTVSSSDHFGDLVL